MIESIEGTPEILITKEPYYRPIGKETEIFTHVYDNKIPLLLKGPTGTGKSRSLLRVEYSVRAVAGHSF
jgi:sigma54-dependent transcription regulator